MRLFLQQILRKPFSRLAEKYGSRPNSERVHQALSALYANLLSNPGKRGPVIKIESAQSFIVFSDQHKGIKNGADNFMLAEKNYLAALKYYDQQNFCYINLGDCEELWGNKVASVLKNNPLSFAAEQRFVQKKAFIKIFGNHDLYWDNDPLANLTLKKVYGEQVKIYEGCILQTEIEHQTLNIFLTHGHQGDLQSDGNWFSKWFISNVWGPVETYLQININTPANNDQLKTAHNSMMADWSARQKEALLITGHTHQPVFKSLTHLEGLYRQLQTARKNFDHEAILFLQQEINLRKLKGDPEPDLTKYEPFYFNSGCCCFNDGDITGIEITKGQIRLVRWKYNLYSHEPERTVLEEAALASLTSNDQD